MSAPPARVRRAFDAAHDYDANARVQRRIAEGLADRVAALPLPPAPRVLEIGCGTGFLTGAMLERGIGGHWLVTDLAPRMVDRCRERIGMRKGLTFAELDGERGTPNGTPFDLIVSSLALQWFDDAPRALSRMRGWLAPGGHCLAATLGPGSFAEWRAAHEAVGVMPGTPSFATATDFAALEGCSTTRDLHVERHTDATAFLRGIKAIGAATAAAHHRPLSPAMLRKVMHRFEQSGATVTYDVLTLHLVAGGRT